MAKARKPRKDAPSLFDVADSQECDAAVPPPPGGAADTVALHEEAQTRYLNYALSVLGAG